MGRCAEGQQSSDVSRSLCVWGFGVGEGGVSFISSLLRGAVRRRHSGWRPGPCKGSRERPSQGTRGGPRGHRSKKDLQPSGDLAPPHPQKGFDDLPLSPGQRCLLNESTRECLSSGSLLWTLLQQKQAMNPFDIQLASPSIPQVKNEEKRPPIAAKGRQAREGAAWPRVNEEARKT